LEHPDPFRIEVAECDSAAVVALHGELDLVTAIDAETVIDAVAERSRSVTLDLRSLTFMDSSGVSVIVRLDARSRRDGFEFSLVEGNDVVQRVLAMCGLDGFVRCVAAPQEWPESERPLEHAVISTDMAGNVTRWNAQAEHLYGWTAGEVLGRPITDLTVGPRDQDVAEEIMECVRRDGRWEGEFEVCRKDGTVLRAFVRDMLMRDRHGNPVGLLGLSVDSAQLASLPG
jgi:anti-anti-sigma factor